MRVSPRADEWLRVLRAQTFAAHRSLESHPILLSLGEGALSLDAYKRALRALAAPQLAMESATANYSEKRNSALAEYQPLKRAPWILQDLGVLNTEPFTLANAWPACNTPAAYIGALYVREGSRFGAQVIARRLNQYLPDISARTFFSLTTPPQWSIFIENASAYEANASLVARAANQVFEALRMHLDAMFAISDQTSTALTC